MKINDVISFDVQLVEVFGQTRDDWMKEDMEDWLNRNPIYDLLPGILNYAIKHEEAYIVTTKQVQSCTSTLHPLPTYLWPGAALSFVVHL